MNEDALIVPRAMVNFVGKGKSSLVEMVKRK